MKQSLLILVAVLLTVCGGNSGRRAPMDAKQIQAKVEELVKVEWEKVSKPLPPGADNPGSPNWIAWSYRISPPFPAAWPPDGTGIACYYAYAVGFQPAALADAERLGPVWARVKVDITGASPPRFEVLAKEIKAVGTIGVRPLRREEAEVYRSGDSVVGQVCQASTKTDTKALDASAVREYYCAWSRDSGQGERIRSYHPEFFKWLGC
jgi:hypothetical protein